jgi:hypothetical protein
MYVYMYERRNKMKFVRKPEEIEAFLYTGDQDQKDDPLWAVEAIKKGVIYFRDEILHLQIDHSGLSQFPATVSIRPNTHYVCFDGVKIYTKWKDEFEKEYEEKRTVTPSSKYCPHCTAADCDGCPVLFGGE